MTFCNEPPKDRMSIIIISFLYAVPVLTLESGESVYLGKRALRFFFANFEDKTSRQSENPCSVTRAVVLGLKIPNEPCMLRANSKGSVQTVWAKPWLVSYSFSFVFCVSPLTLAISYLLFKGMGELCCIL